MLRSLIRNEWLALSRAAWGRQRIATRVLGGMMLLFLAAQMAVAAFMLAYVFLSERPADDLPRLLGLATCALLIIDLLIRLPWQRVPWSVIAPYLSLPLAKARLADYLTLKSFLNGPNLLALALGLPFAAGFWAHPRLAFLLALQVYGLILMANNGVLRLRGLGDAPLRTWISRALGIAVPVCATLALAVYRGWFTPAWLDDIGNALAPSPWLAASAWGVGLISTHRTWAWIHRSLTIDPPASDATRRPSRIADAVGWIRFEWLLVVRNRRCRAVLIPNWFLIVWLPAFGGASTIRHGISSLDVMACMFFFVISVQPAMLTTAESTMYDRLATLPVSLGWRLRRKLHAARCVYLYHAIPVSAFLLWLGIDVTALLLTLLFYTLALPAVLFQTAYHRTRFEIDQRAMFNFQGSDNSTPFLSGLPLFTCMLAPPLILVALGLVTGNPTIGRTILGILALLLLVLQKPVTNRLVAIYRVQHYSKAEGYRQRG